ncbi:MAG: chemotaxis protein CheA [Rhodocyclaceae bacterium]|nr:chemotaxis protein CheA [Rhodocyclaceae bacterium]
MNPLLEQFVIESRDFLEAIAQGLLILEREPGNSEAIDELFRGVHTLKGNSGLFPEYAAFTHLVHAGEDLLDSVRDGQRAFDPEIADHLLECMDIVSAMLDCIEGGNDLAPTLCEAGKALAVSLRALRAGPLAAAGEAADDYAGAPADAGEPADDLPPGDASVGGNAPAAASGGGAALGSMQFRYTPEPGCFFKGDDPLFTAINAPGLLRLSASARRPWAADEGFDPYDCNLVLEGWCDARREALEQHFRYVPEQVEWSTIASTSGQALPVGVVDEATAPQVGTLAGRGLTEKEETAAGRILRCQHQALARELDSLAAGTGRAGEPAEAVAEHTANRVLKVSQEKIDRLMDLIGEMVVAKNALPYLAARAEVSTNPREIAREIKNQYGVINRIAEEMQDTIMQVRMLPVGNIFQRFPRLVRDISRKLGKQVELYMEGEDAEADKNIVESLADPLIHIVRNSLDHGLEPPDERRAAGKAETGVIRISAFQEADRVIIEISDDGRGIDPARVKAKALERGLIDEVRAAAMTDQEAVQLVFAAGFSTAEQISDLSGRGVGMDVVRTAIERAHGQVHLASEPGRGTRVRIALPLSMAVTNVMIIRSAGQMFGVQMDMVVETVRVPAEAIHQIKQQRTTVLRGRIVPLYALNDLLYIPEPPVANEAGEVAVLVIRLGDQDVGVIVDDFDATLDLVLKPLDGVLGALGGYSGTALLGDGSVLMVLNLKDLL